VALPARPRWQSLLVSIAQRVEAGTIAFKGSSIAQPSPRALDQLGISAGAYGIVIFVLWTRLSVDSTDAQYATVRFPVSTEIPGPAKVIAVDALRARYSRAGFDASSSVFLWTVENSPSVIQPTPF
jgi:hypothetical protein